MQRIQWKDHRELLEDNTDDWMAAYLNTSTDAVRLARKRFADPAHGYIGFNLLFFDLETTGLSAIMGRLLCASFCDSWGQVTTFRADEMGRENAIDDRELAVAIRDYIEANSEILVGWNSKLYDVPMLNARLLRWNERPLRKDLMHLDLMYFARGQFVRIGSSRLKNVQKFIPEVQEEKTEIAWEIWALAGTGDKKAMEYIVKHCEADILVLREVFAGLKAHVTTLHR